MPNAMFYPVRIDVDASLADDAAGGGGALSEAQRDALAQLVWYETPPLTFEARRCLRAVVVVALRAIEDGEEVLVDYRMGEHAPPWYHPVDYSGGEEMATYAEQEPAPSIASKLQALSDIF